MARQRKRPTPRSGPRPRAGPPPRARSRKRLPLVALVGAAALLAAIVWIVRRPVRPPAAHAGSKIDGMPARELADSILVMRLRHDHFGSLPYVLRLRDLHLRAGTTKSEVYLDVAHALSNSTFQVNGRHTATRSSYERMALAFGAFAEVERALELAQSPQERAQALDTLGQLFSAWGLAYDANATFSEAFASDPQWMLAHGSARHAGGPARTADR